MAVRKRFRRDEVDAFVSGTVVQWLNGSQWLDGTIVSGPAHTDDVDGRPYVLIRNARKTRTTLPSEIVRGYPGGVRIPDRKWVPVR